MSLVVANASSGPTTITLSAITVSGIVTVKDSGSASATNTVTIQATAGNTFESGLTSYTLNTASAYMTFVGNASTLKWRVLGSTYADIPVVSPVPTASLGGNLSANLSSLSVSGLTTLGNTSNTGNLGVAGTTTLNTLSVTGQAAFSKSVQVQGSMSVFSSIATTNLNFSGGLYSNGVLFTGGSGSPTFSTISTIGQASFNSNVQVGGSLSVFSSISAYNVNAVGMNVNTLAANTGFAQINLTLPSSRGICFDPSGNMYVNSSYLYTIYKITPQGVTSLLAGSYGLAGTTDGTGSTALFANSPQQMCYDSYTGGIAMATNTALRLISLTGVVTTIASGFSSHYGVCSDGAGNFYITDNHCVKRVTISSPTPAANSGVVTTIAGNGTALYNNGPGATANFWGPYHIVINSSKTALYVADITNNVIRQVMVASPYTVTTLAGPAPTTGSAATPGTTDSTTATSVSFTSPVSMAIDANNNIFVGDYGNNRIRYINVSPFYTLTIGGDGTFGTLAGVGANSQINTPHAMTIDPYGSLWVVTYNNGAIFNYNSKTGYFNLLFQNINTAPKPVNIQNTALSTIVAPAIATATLYGSGFTITNSNSANPGGATYQSPNGVLLDSQNNVYVCDNRRLRKITPSGLVTSVYGDVTNTQATTQLGTGPEGVSNILYQSMCFDNSGNMYLSQYAGNSILKINLATGSATTLTITTGSGSLALNGPNGMLFKDNTLYVMNQNPGNSNNSFLLSINLSTNTSSKMAGNDGTFSQGFSICFDVAKTNIYVSNYAASNIKIVNISTNAVSTFSTSGLPGLVPIYITSDNLGNFYCSGTYTGIPVTRGIIKITSAGVASSFCNTVTLNGASVNIGVPTGLAVDSYNNVYFADANLLLIGVVTPGGSGSVYSGANGSSGTQDSTYASSITLMAPYVGINNANPTSALDVNGNANVTGSSIFGASAYFRGSIGINYNNIAGAGINIYGVGPFSGLGTAMYVNSSGTSAIEYKFNNLYISDANGVGVHLDKGGQSWIAHSDERLKENIIPITNALTFCSSLRTVKYSLISQNLSTANKIGFIAQDFVDEHPEVSSTDINGNLGLAYTDTIPIAVAAIKELNTIVEEQSLTISTLQSDSDLKASTITGLQSALDSQQSTITSILSKIST